MSGFDAALRRLEAAQRSADASRQSQVDRHRRAAQAAVPRVTQLLREFALGLSSRGVQPRRVQIKERDGLLHPARFSPDGYEVMAHRFYTKRLRDKKVLTVPHLSLVTPDGRLWIYTPARGEGFVEITADTLLGYTSNSIIWLDGYSYITYSSNGEAVVHRNGDPPESTPLEKVLAASALRLIQES